jgi:gentisate 1,2-dioxygenase
MLDLSYKDLRPYLIRAGQLVSEHEAERRVLMLINPAMREVICQSSKELR